MLKPVHIAIVVLISLWPLSSPGQTAYTDMTPDRPGISVLAPVQSFPVVSNSTLSPGIDLALEPLDEDPLATMPTADEPSRYARVNGQPGVDALASASSGAIDYAPGSGLEARASVALGGRAGDPDRWMPGVSGFTYTQDNGAAFSVGQVVDPITFWGDSPRLGGVQLVKLPTATSRGTLLPGDVGLSTSVGFRTQQEISSANTSGGLTVGAPVGMGSLRMGVTRDLTVESRLQAGSSAGSAGLGGTYAFSDWGTVQVSTVQSQNAESPGLPAWPVSRSGLGLQVHWDAHQLESTYASSRDGQNLSAQRVGIKHHWLLWPQITLQMGADRELAGGSYSMHMQLSVPIERLAAGWWHF